MMKRFAICLAATAALSFGLSRPANASVYLQLSDDSGGNTGFLSSAGDTVTYSSTIGNFNVVISVAVRTESSGSGVLDITNTVVTLNPGVSTGTHVLTIQAGADGYNNPTGTPLFYDSSGSANYNNTLGDTMTFRSFFDKDNTQVFGAGVGTAGFSLPFPAHTGSQSLSGNDPLISVARTGAYSLSSIMTLSLTNAVVNPALPPSVNAHGSSVTTTAVPEPSTMVSMAIGLPLLTLALRRRKASK